MSVQQHAQVTVAQNVSVTDAYVDFSGHSKELYVLIDSPLDPSDALPVAQSETGADWVAETDGGLIWSFHDGPVYPPADEAPRTETITVTRADGTSEQRVPNYSHVTTAQQNEREPDSALEVSYKAPDGYWRPVTTRVKTARDIVATYINGDRGDDNNAYWHYRKQTMPMCEPDPAITDDVELVRDDIRTWVPQRA